MNLTQWMHKTMKHQFSFKSRDINAQERIKWCRDNFGDRGGRWDFAGGFNITIFIRDAADAEEYNKIWRFWNVLKGDDKAESYHIS